MIVKLVLLIKENPNRGKRVNVLPRNLFAFGHTFSQAISFLLFNCMQLKHSLICLPVPLSIRSSNL